MNIIEAIQKAEMRHLITNGTLKQWNRFYKYIQNGVFFEYEIIGESTKYLYEVRDFSVADILSTSWEVVEKKDTYFKSH